MKFDFAAEVSKGVASLADYLADRLNFALHWADIVGELTLVARNASDEKLAFQARRIAIESIELARRNATFSTVAPITLNDCITYSVAELSCSELNIRRLLPRELLVRMNLSYREVPRSRGSSPAEVIEEQALTLVCSYLGHRVGAPFTIELYQAIAEAFRFRPYIDSLSGGNCTYRAQCFLVTHIVYVLSNYNDVFVDPAQVAPERDFMMWSLGKLIAMRDVELVGEYLSALRTCGISETERLLVDAAIWLADQQNVDGSWGDTTARNGEANYHSTVTAVQGLRGYRRHAARIQ